MEREQFNMQIEIAMKEIGITINAIQKEQFYQYMNVLIEWNQKMNLTAITDPEEIIIKHFVDCSTIIKYLREDENIIDIGTGAGFPGIVVKIFLPKAKIILVDSLNKRINFLEEVIREIKLQNLELIHSRIEDLARDYNYREKFDCVVSRAVAPLNVLLEYTFPFLKVKGKCICMKGSNVDEEIKVSKKALEILGAEIIKKEELILPKINLPRNILEIEKRKVTPETYPRKAGIPSKMPIQ